MKPNLVNCYGAVSHTVIAPYEIFLASFGTKSHNRSSAVPSDYVTPRENKVSLCVNGQAESNELLVYEDVRSLLSAGMLLTTFE